MIQDLEHSGCSLSGEDVPCPCHGVISNRDMRRSPIGMPLRVEIVPRSAGPWTAARAAALLVALTGLGACASSTPVPTFDLSAPRQFSASSASSSQIVVPMPTALSALDTERILVEPSPGQITYLSGAQWADRLPALVHARIVESFENAGKGARVARPGDGISGNFQLSLDIRSFSIQVTPSGPLAVVEISARVIANPEGRIVGSRIFTARVATSEVTGPSATQALDTASDQVFIELVRWVSGRF